MINRAVSFFSVHYCLLFSFSVLSFLSPGCKTARVSSSPPVFETTTIFEPMAGEYSSMRIPALVITHKATLLAFCEGRITSASDWADMDLLMRRSTDGGKTWSDIRVIAPRQGKPVSNPTPIADTDGNIHLLFQRDYASLYYTRSTDDGRTWSSPTDITATFEQFTPEYNWNVLAPGPGHAIQLRSGRLLAPVWMAASEKLEPRRNHHPSRVATIYSDDLGKTWKRGSLLPESPEIRDPSEMMAVELRDGRVMLSIRNSNEIKRRAVSYSADGISGWSTPAIDDELFDPICMASIIRVPAPRNKETGPLLFVNPDSRHLPKTPRQNLTAKLSYDEGGSWTIQKVLEPGPSGYSDLAVGPDGTIYCLYETLTVGTGRNYSLLLKRFNLAWLVDKIDRNHTK